MISRTLTVAPKAFAGARLKLKSALLALVLLGLTACGNKDPGPLKGVWQLGAIPMTIHFRSGETEAMGMIEKVSYERNGSDVIVTSESGPMKGVAVRYTVVDANTLRTELGVLRRIR